MEKARVKAVTHTAPRESSVSLESSAHDRADAAHHSAGVRMWKASDRRAYLIAKRCIDLVICSVGLLAIAPLFVVIALLIFLLDGRPVFFRREVIGLNGKLFYMLKFRTMSVQAEEMLQADPNMYEAYRRQNYKLRADPRVTRFGQFLRKYSLDELPQLWNILRGEMTLVGPRSVPLSEIGEFGAFAPLRQCVQPGLTGLWQVSGRADTSYADRIRLDREYVLHCSLSRDLLILLRTLPCVIRGVGAY
jgi:exopolysaccharide production protein ExoY